MSIATSTAIGIAGGLGLAGSVGGALIGSNASSNAASSSANASDYAANLNFNLGEQALDFQEGVYNNQQTNEAPYLQSGYGGLANLDYLLGIPTAGVTPSSGSTTGTLTRGGFVPQHPIGAPGKGVPLSSLTSGGPWTGRGALPAASRASLPLGESNGPPPVAGPGSLQTQAPSAGPPAGQLPVNLSSLVNPSNGAFGSLSKGWDQTFQAPTLAQAEQNPGYQFQLQQGEQALQDSAAAQGGLITGGEGKALTEFGQGLAQTDYQNVYNNAIQQYQMAYNQFQQNQANQYNRLANMAGLGQVSAGQLGTSGQSSANNIASILANTGQNVGNAVQNAGNATASGYLGRGNAINQGIGGGVNSISSALSLASLLGGSNTDTSFANNINGNLALPDWTG